MRESTGTVRPIRRDVSTPVTVELSETLLGQLDAICARYDVTRPEALRFAITVSMRQLGQPATEYRGQIAEAVDKLRVASADIDAAIKRIARVTHT